MEIRLVRTEEFDAVGDLMVRAYRQLPDAAAAAPYEPRLRDVAGRAELAEVLVAIDDSGMPLGSVTFVPGPGPLAESEDPDDAHIRMLAVAPEAQGRGVGRALVEACIERARAAGKRRVLLKTRQSMASAHRIYGSLGFRPEPLLNRDQGNVPLLGYCLELTSARAVATSQPGTA